MKSRASKLHLIIQSKGVPGQPYLLKVVSLSLGRPAIRGRYASGRQGHLRLLPPRTEVGGLSFSNYHKKISIQALI